MPRMPFLNKKKRLKRVADLTLGTVEVDPDLPPIFSGQIGSKSSPSNDGGSKTLEFRRNELLQYEKYYESVQYNHLMPWDDACCAEDYVRIRERVPRLIYPFAKTLCSRIASKLVGDGSFPKISVPDDPDTSAFVREVVKAARLKSRLLEASRRMCNDGSVFVRFYIRGSALKVEHFISNYCYPKLDDAGELEELEVRYVFEDPNDIDPSTGKFRQKWYRQTLGRQQDVLFDTPYFKRGAIPEFTVVDVADHGFGFVQGEWFRTDEDRHVVDGYSIIRDILDFIDEFCYSLSQSSQASSYNQDPQLVFNKMDQEEMDCLIRSSTKAWNLGKEGEAKFLEAGMKGIEAASELRDHIKLNIGEICRVVFVDPDKAVASAQSGKAMEVLYAPFVELINELRPVVEDRIVALILKMMMAMMILKSQGVQDLPVSIPDGYSPLSLNLVPEWAPVFPMTIDDLQKKINAGVAAAAANVISRETITGWLASDFGVEDIEAEVARVAAQPVINPFGGF